MHKGIYLNVTLLVDGVPDDQRATAHERIGEIVGRAGGTPGVALSCAVKRVRPGPDSGGGTLAVEALLYLEGEQDAPRNFYILAAGALRQMLSEDARGALPPGWQMRIAALYEHTGAVDELADEEDSG